MGDWNMNEVILALQGTYGVETPAFDRAWGFFKDAEGTDRQANFMSNFGVKPIAKVGAQGIDVGAGIGDVGAGIGALGAGIDYTKPIGQGNDYDPFTDTSSDWDAPPDDGMSMETMGAIMGLTQAAAGLGGQFQAYKAQKQALKLE